MVNKIRIYRVIKGYRQLDLARLMGENYAEQKISQLENLRRNPTGEEIAKLSEIFQVKAIELFPELFGDVLSK
jgi:transcriptional regulator with XRE-family HTH domain